MKPDAQPKDGTMFAEEQVRAKFRETDVELVVDESEKMREQIRLQATEVGPILEALLHDVHGQIRWGLNE